MKKKILLTAVLAASCALANAYEVTIQNSTDTKDPYFVPLIVFHSFFKEKGLGDIAYISNNKPNTYHNMGNSPFSAFTGYRTSSTDFGNALISTHALTVGNIKSDDGKKTNFVVALRQREGRVRIGPMPCVSDDKKQCYEIPHATVRVKINNKAYPELVDTGEVVLPKGDFYKVQLNVVETVEQIEVSKVKPIDESQAATKRKWYIQNNDADKYNKNF